MKRKRQTQERTDANASHEHKTRKNMVGKATLVDRGVRIGAYRGSEMTQGKGPPDPCDAFSIPPSLYLFFKVIDLL